MDALRRDQARRHRADGGGYRIDPQLPLASFSLRLPNVGVAVRRGVLRGYVRPQRGGPLQIEVALRGRVKRFKIRTRAGRATNFAVRFP